MGGYKANFRRSIIFSFFHSNQNNGYLYDIAFIFGRCHHSWAAETPDKYERDWKYLTYTFAEYRIKISHNGEINQRNFSNLHPCSARSRSLCWEQVSPVHSMAKGVSIPD